MTIIQQQSEFRIENISANFVVILTIQTRIDSKVEISWYVFVSLIKDGQEEFQKSLEILKVAEPLRLRVINSFTLVEIKKQA